MGEVLFTAGAFIGLFLVWQLWWTNIEASENNSVAVAELDGVFEPEVVQRAERHTDAPPVIQPRGSNEPFAKLYVPRWGSSTLAIAEGLSYANVLDHGLVGHYPDTASIGEVGNAGLAAHRMTRGAVFQNIQDLQPGDELIVEGDSAWIVFSVTGHEVVNPNDGQVLLPVPHQPGVEADTPHLTLTTCHPLMSTRERYIVYSEFEYWIPRDEGMPDALLEK